MEEASKGRKSTAKELYLPKECWECIIKFINTDDHINLKPISLVSKQFLSITNSLIYSLNVFVPTVPFLHCLILRFTNLTSLDFSRYNGADADIDVLLCQIRVYPLHLKYLNISNSNTIPQVGFRSLAKKMKTLTSLICSNIGSISKSDPIVIADCFPFLEELDLSFPQKIETNTNILSLALPKLRKVNLSGIYYIDDSSFFHLCKNCEHLEEVVMFDCIYLTHVGIASAIRERPNLKSFSISMYMERMYASSKMINSVRSLKGLTCLNLSSFLISDHFLSSLAEEGLPLNKLVLQNCVDYTYAGICSLLSKCQLLQHLDLEHTWFLTDQHVTELSNSFLGDLVSINLSRCSKLTELALFALLKNCHFLNEIRMENMNIGIMGVEKNNSLVNNFVNSEMKSLHLTGNPWLHDETINFFPKVCPNLEVLDLSYGPSISKSIVEILRTCCKMKHLNLTNCLKVNLHGMNFQVPTLEVLNLSKTMIDDETLYVISKSFSELLILDLEQCRSITDKGVKQVIEQCRQLKEINVRRCPKVSVRVGLWKEMILSRPSLKKIMAPSRFRISNRTKSKILSNHGCFIY